MPFCERCFEEFEDERNLSAHVRQNPPCELRELKEPEGITKVQKDQLRKRGKRAASERDKWYEMYKILFPEGPEPPSPYYEPEDGSFDLNATAVRQNILREVEERVRESLAHHPLELAQSAVRLTLEAVQSSMGEILNIVETSGGTGASSQEPYRRETDLTDPISVSNSSTTNSSMNDVPSSSESLHYPPWSPSAVLVGPVHGGLWSEDIPWMPPAAAEAYPSFEPLDDVEFSFGGRRNSAVTVRKVENEDSQTTNDTAAADQSGSSTTSPSHAGEESTSPQKAEDNPSTPPDRGDASGHQAGLGLHGVFASAEPATSSQSWH
ncbi:hypothetical protein OQA88_2258 [Cercophora sp. LCS_1]